MIHDLNIKNLNEEKLEKCSDVAGKLFQVMTIRSQKTIRSYINKTVMQV